MNYVFLCLCEMTSINTRPLFSFLVVFLLHTTVTVTATTVEAAAAASVDSSSTHSPLTVEDVSKSTTRTYKSTGVKVTAQFNSDKCTIEYGTSNKNEVLNLKQLARVDGLPRYNATFDVTQMDFQTSFNYSYNPCVAYSLPLYNPHDNFGDGCHNAIVCKYTYSQESSNFYYFTLGIKSVDKVKASAWKQPNNGTRISLVYTGIKSMRMAETVVTLVCDPSRSSVDQGLFKIVTDDGRYRIFAELHHKCCCPGACAEVKDPKPEKDGETMLVVVGTVVGLLLSVLLIGGLCYVKRTHVQFYSKLPGVRPTLVSNGNNPLGGGGGDGKNTDLRDYEPSAMSGVRHKLLPVLEDSCIHSTQVEMGKRLGGGIFGDTHLGRFNGMTVTVKRLTLSIHLDQLTGEMMGKMKEEVSWISRQRHKNMVSVLGLSLDGRLPFLMTEYVLGDCVKDFLKSNGNLLTWPQRVRLCQQVAEGVSFLHNTKPPVIHRDLRCGNLFISDNDLVKVADFSLTKLLQPMREQCDTDDCSCNRLMSACPATIRWTAPEMLASPRAKEGESSTISTACDVYSLGLVLWEMVMVRDPFHEMKTESEVIEVVRNGGRPDIPPNKNMLSPYKDMMKTCWDQRPSLRPQCKQVAVRLKDMVGAARSHQRQINNRQAFIQKSQDNMAV